MRPLVSIIVPIYNTAKYLPACLDSIINQTYQNLEIILVDDGSTDNSSQIANRYAKKDSRVKLIHQTNKGLSSARNTGIANSTGKYLTFVDSDDYIKPAMITSLLQAIQSSNANIAICSFKETYPNGKVTHPSHHYATKIYGTADALSAMLQEQGFMVSATMKLFPRIFFKDIRFPNGKLHEDIGTTYKLILQAKSIIFIPNEYYIYCHHDDSIIARHFDDRKLDIITLTDQMCNDIDLKFPNLKDVTNERRMRARFSVLRQIPATHPKVKPLLNYLKIHQGYIAKNPKATKADRIALKLALKNIKLFQLAYKLFK